MVMTIDSHEHEIDTLLKGLHIKVVTELYSAINKHGATRTPSNPWMLNSERFIILMEEIGEVARAMTYDHKDLENLEKELVQVVTMASAWLVGLWRSESENW